MTTSTRTLDQLRVASPCKASWAEMQGTDRVRFCSLCALNVYDVSAMSRKEAELLVQKAEGRLCVRFFRRADGTILTQDCPKGLRAVRMRIARFAAVFTGIVFALLGAGCERRSTMGDVAVPPPPSAVDGDVPQVRMGVTMSDPLQPTMGESAPTTR